MFEKLAVSGDLSDRVAGFGAKTFAIGLSLDRLLPVFHTEGLQFRRDRLDSSRLSCGEGIRVIETEFAFETFDSLNGRFKEIARFG